MSINLIEIIEKTINSFETENNSGKMWRTPIASSLSADNPLIPSIKQSVSSDHLLPWDLLPGAKSVVVFFIPFENHIVISNLKGEPASEEWAQAYILTNSLIGAINDEIETVLCTNGYKSEKIKATHNFFNTETLMSRWSHRHYAYLAGLGAFGINNMLITSKGCCGRFGSFVTDAECNIFGVPYDSGPLSEKCLNKIDGSCALCQKRCKASAYDTNGKFNRFKCYEACLKNADIYRRIGLADVCGKCLVGLPCSHKFP